MKEIPTRVSGGRSSLSPTNALLLAALVSTLTLAPDSRVSGQPSIVSPAERFGHVIGADRKLVHWDQMVEYFRGIGEASDRVHVRELGPTTQGHPFLLLEISSAKNLADIDRYKTLEKRLYFQDHRPGQEPTEVHSEEERRELFENGKAVVLVTCSIHATEVGAAQMSLELVHQLATSHDPKVEKILDHVIFLLVPSLNPDGQSMVVDWYNRHLGTDFEGGPMPWLYHPYVGHDNNRDMYMYTQAETGLIGKVLYEEWFPSIWLDEHQMGSMEARIFVMPATDPININVHPLIYRLNGIYGQAQGAALEAAGKVGIIYDDSYTNFWVGAMGWTGWWHNQVGMLTELASVRVATPVEQNLAKLGEAPKGPPPDYRQMRRHMMEKPKEPLPPPPNAQPRTNYPRPWLGGKWTLRDIVDYELIATMALLETAADTRRQLIEQIYEVNQTTIAQFLEGQKKGSYQKTLENGGYAAIPEGVPAERPGTGRILEGAVGAAGTPYAILVPPHQHDPATARKMLRLLDLGGVLVETATADFQADGKTYPAATQVIRLAQVFGRYAKDLLEPQTYPEVRLDPSLPAPPPYDVTAWSLGMLMGVETTFVDEPFEAQLEIVENPGAPQGRVVGNGSVFLVDASANDGFRLANRLLGSGARVRRSRSGFQSGGSPGTKFSPGTWVIQDVSRTQMDQLAQEMGLTIRAVGGPPQVPTTDIQKPRIAVYQPWGSNMDEGWTRWLMEQFGFDYTTLHPQDLRAAGNPDSSETYQISEEERKVWPPHVAQRAPGNVLASPLAERYDVILFTDQEAEDIVKGEDYPVIPPLYRGGLGEEGLEALRVFVDAGKTLVAMGDATTLFVQRWAVPVKSVVAGLKQEEFFIPGSILNVQTDPSHPLAWGMPQISHAYFSRNPVFTVTDAFPSQKATVPVRYPNTDLRASGWVRGPEHIEGHAAAVQVDIDGGGRLILLGLRPQLRAQTHATFKLLFNALMMPRGPF